MTSKISFVREFAMGTEKCYDVVYKSNRLFMCSESTMPKTVRSFINNAKNVTTQYDKVFKREEIIYEEK